MPFSFSGMCSRVSIEIAVSKNKGFQSDNSIAVIKDGEKSMSDYSIMSDSSYNVKATIIVDSTGQVSVEAIEEDISLRKRVGV